MPKSFTSVFIVLLMIALHSGAVAESYRDPKAVAVIKASKAATGGAEWDKLEGVYETGEHSGAPYRTWLDFRGYGMRNENRRGASTVTMGYNGLVAWRISDSETIRMTDAAALSEARTTAYLSNNGFFFPDRFNASLKYLRRAKEKAAQFDVIEAIPDGGRGFEMWFDRKSHLLSRIIDTAGTQRITVTASDYRWIDGIRGPFRFVVTDGSGTVVNEGKVLTVIFRPVSRAVFEPEATIE